MSTRSLYYFLLLFISISLPLSAQQSDADDSFDDGPYVFIRNDSLIEQRVMEGELVTTLLEAESLETHFPPAPAVYTGVERIAALSDIHGQYDLAVELLTANGIIDKDQNWKFGKGHLVVVGDVFDRGPQVTETLWLLYRLEQQAASKGGRVQLLLGNHEYMVLYNDLRYLHPKYTSVSELFGRGYDQLYGEDTVLGRWLRAKPTMIKINDILFVHGGISAAFLEAVEFDIEAINDKMLESIGRTKAEMKPTDYYQTYFGIDGPVWYRGYFEDNLPESHITELLRAVSASHFVVGHCTERQVVSMYNNKVLGVDSGIKRGSYGELLLILKGRFYRGMLDGERVEF